MKQLFKKDKVTLQKYKANFTTVDGIKHSGLTYAWAVKDRLRCGVPEYIMIDIKSEGYIEDENEVMYMLQNVISIEWKLEKEIVVDDNFNNYQVYVSSKEVESCT